MKHIHLGRTKFYPSSVLYIYLATMGIAHFAKAEAPLEKFLPKAPPPCIKKRTEGFTHVTPTDWNACTRKVEGFLRIPLDDLRAVYLTAPPKPRPLLSSASDPSKLADKETTEIEAIQDQNIPTTDVPSSPANQQNRTGDELEGKRTATNQPLPQADVAQPGVASPSRQTEKNLSALHVVEHQQDLPSESSAEIHQANLTATPAIQDAQEGQPAQALLENRAIPIDTKSAQPQPDTIEQEGKGTASLISLSLPSSAETKIESIENQQKNILVPKIGMNTKPLHSSPFVSYHGHSLVLLPPKLKTKKPYVFVYLHGFNHQVVNQQKLDFPRLEYDRFAEQIQKSGHTKDLIGFFPQADSSMMASQGPANMDFDINASLAEAFSRLQLKSLPEQAPLILVGHSGGGRVLRRALAATTFHNLKSVVFLDGVNGEKEVPLVKDYLTRLIEKQLDWLKDHPSAKQRKAYFRSIPRFSFYYTFQYRSYPKNHKLLTKQLCQFWNEQSQKVKPNQRAMVERLRTYYQILPLEKTITHSDIMRSGVVEKILKRLPYLTS